MSIHPRRLSSDSRRGAESQTPKASSSRREEIEREIDALLEAVRKFLLLLVDCAGTPPKGKH